MELAAAYRLETAQKKQNMDKLDQFFPDFDFGDVDEDDDIFLDASQVANDSAQSAY